MNIALMAHDRKKELMTQFCIAYCGILAEHRLCATHVTGKLVSDATGLPITLYMHASEGGAQQIAARLAFNEIDLVIFFCDPSNPKGFDDINRIERLCDTYQIPFATNAATAEVLVQGLRRGDLDWRNIVNPPYKPRTKT
ncbi:MAG: methylglyoxal synthase [Oscillospiraceae bacterium]|nr:methylglyoxal synthase [Oscillospiraceae bacterium]MBQ3373475.1 methylglyoxal synthase [Oscillospiraceae bacterium]MBQ5521905.1 methylglyoxal synthase [Oscillospiraceae bacterium]